MIAISSLVHTRVGAGIGVGSTIASFFQSFRVVRPSVMGRGRPGSIGERHAEPRW